MKITKRIILIILSALLIFSVTACGKAEDKPKGEENTPPSSDVEQKTPQGQNPEYQLPSEIASPYIESNFKKPDEINTDIEEGVPIDPPVTGQSLDYRVAEFAEASDKFVPIEIFYGAGHSYGGYPRDLPITIFNMAKGEEASVTLATVTITHTNTAVYEVDSQNGSVTYTASEIAAFSTDLLEGNEGTLLVCFGDGCKDLYYKKNEERFQFYSSVE